MTEKNNCALWVPDTREITPPNTATIDKILE
jgi:hypothetical protein